MEELSCFVYAYMLVIVYEFMTDEKNHFAKWLLIVLIGILKNIIELSTYIKYLSPFLICTIFVLYSMMMHSKKSNLKNLQYAFVTYGINYVISVILSFACAIIAGFFRMGKSGATYGILSIGRIIVIIGLYKTQKYFEKFNQSWTLYIVVIATAVLLFTEQVLRAAYAIKNKSAIYLCISFIYIAALFTTLWLMDHYKMAKIQKMYAEDNKQMSQKLHRSKEILPMIANYVSSMDGIPDDRMRQKLEEVCHDYGKELGGAEMSAEFFETTGIDLVDLLLRTKIIECSKQDIELSVFVNTQINRDMKQLDVGDGEITRLLGDLLRNAMNAVEDVADKMILLLIARDENGCVLIRIYDSGMPFSEEILERFGERGNTTWGTGNGLADLMETLNRTQASIEIDTELEPDDVFTKGIYICFDGNDDVRIHKKDDDLSEME